MKNYGLMEYGFVESVEFEGIMPLASKNIGTVGASDVIVKMHGSEALGHEALESTDIEALFVSSTKNESIEEVANVQDIEVE